MPNYGRLKVKKGIKLLIRGFFLGGGGGGGLSVIENEPLLAYFFFRNEDILYQDNCCFDTLKCGSMLRNLKKIHNIDYVTEMRHGYINLQTGLTCFGQHKFHPQQALSSESVETRKPPFCSIPLSKMVRRVLLHRKLH